MENTPLPVDPFGKIALSCSGGGYRAAAFHLGSMAYLNRLEFGGTPLLEHVKLISTVSGGTITGVVYAMMKQQGRPFEEIYNFLLQTLINTDLLQSGIEKLNPNAVWPYTYKRKNLINVFAAQYNEAFTNGAMMDVFEDMSCHLEAVVFNCTDFEHAVNFRFRNPGNSYAGNYYNRITLKQLSEVKLSDVMAASSCFPGGFEPMCWPDDFVHEHSPNLKEMADRNATAGISPLGIMDGGIYDNQGVDSILRYKEGSEQPYFDLVILSDVASPEMRAFVPFKEQPKKGFRALTIKTVKTRVAKIDRWAGGVLWLIVALGALFPFIFDMRANWLAGVCWTFAGFASLFLVLRFLAKKQLHLLLFRLFLKIRDNIAPFYLRRLALFDIDELSVHRAEPLIMDRVNSLIILLTSVFLKVVRRLNYNRLYGQDVYQFRRLSTLIKCLTRDNLVSGSKDKRKPGFFTGDYDTDIGPAIQQVVEEAAAFGTTLWFTEQELLDDVLKKLVATGQATMCYNMILYIEQLRNSKDDQYGQLDEQVRMKIDSLYTQCTSDWALFRQQPMTFV